MQYVFPLKNEKPNEKYIYIYSWYIKTLFDVPTDWVISAQTVNVNLLLTGKQAKDVEKRDHNWCWETRTVTFLSSVKYCLPTFCLTYILQTNC
jgi:hypothetical protein